MNIVLDLETNGFLDKDNLVIHCIVCKDIETHQLYKYNPDNLNGCLDLLKKAKAIIGHNVLGFDIPVIKKVLTFTYQEKAFVTLIMSRLIWTNILDLDYNHKDLPAILYGTHSLAFNG